MTARDADLNALFAEPAALSDSRPLQHAILATIQRQQRRRNLLLAVASFAGALPVALLVAAMWPAIETFVDSLTGAMQSAFRHEIALSLPEISQIHAWYGVWVMAALGLLATAAAALRVVQSR